MACTRRSGFCFGGMTCGRICPRMVKASFTLMLLLHAAHAALIDITGVDRLVLFMKLYNKASLLGRRRSMFSTRVKKIDESRAMGHVGKYVEAPYGVKMYICVPAERNGNFLDARKYDAIYEPGLARRVVDKIRDRPLRKKAKQRFWVRCLGCRDAHRDSCCSVCDHLTLMRFPCAIHVCRTACSAAAFGIGFLAYGLSEAFIALTVCATCNGIACAICDCCYCKDSERTIREVIEANAPDICTNRNRDAYARVGAECTGNSAGGPSHMRGDGAAQGRSLLERSQQIFTEAGESQGTAGPSKALSNK